MTDKTRLMVVRGGEGALPDLMEMMKDAGCDVTLLDCSENEEVISLLPQVVDGDGATELVGVLVISRSKPHITKQRSPIPICAHCKKIRDDMDNWDQPEVYFGTRFHVVFTHGICPSCADGLRTDMRELAAKRETD